MAVVSDRFWTSHDRSRFLGLLIELIIVSEIKFVIIHSDGYLVVGCKGILTVFPLDIIRHKMVIGSTSTSD